MTFADRGRVAFLGAPFDRIGREAVVAALAARRAGEPFGYVVTPNVDHVVRLDWRPELTRVYDGAWLSLCDSHPVRRLARWRGLDLPHVTGAAVTADLFDRVVAPGDHVAIIGATPALLAALAARFQGVRLTSHIPPIGFIADPAARAAAVDFGFACGARFLFIAVGSPQAEILAAEIATRPGATGTALCTGAALEFLVGHKARAPRWLRHAGLEWMHRLAAEPGRLWRRYLLGALPLAALFRRELGGPRHGAIRRTFEQRSPRRRPLVLHLTGDYPDPLRPPTTQAVKRLVDAATGCDHVVISLYRTALPWRTHLAECPAPAGQRLYSYRHFGLPFGVGLQRSFAIVARRVARLLEREGLEPDVVHAHRTTFDGLAGDAIARQYGIAHLVSVRGEVESKVLRFKPTYRPLVRDIVVRAARVYYVSAWFRPSIETLVGGPLPNARLLPNLVDNVSARIEPRPARPLFVAAANLDIYRKKGIDRLIRAFARAAPRLPGIGLDIYGDGAGSAIATLQRLIDRLGLHDRVTLEGPLPHRDLLAALPHYLAMALPGRNETFGMVYVEALFAGIPVLHGRDTGIDGYLDGFDFGRGVDPDDIDAIAAALLDLAERNVALRSAIAAAAPELQRRFDPAHHVALYEADIAALAAERERAVLVHLSEAAE